MTSGWAPGTTAALKPPLKPDSGKKGAARQRPSAPHPATAEEQTWQYFQLVMVLLGEANMSNILLIYLNKITQKI